MAPPSSKNVIFAALAGHFVVALIKFAASAFTGSSAMLTAAQVEATVSAVEGEIKAEYPQVDRVFIEAQSLVGHRQARRGIG